LRARIKVGRVIVTGAAPSAEAICAAVRVAAPSLRPLKSSILEAGLIKRNWIEGNAADDERLEARVPRRDDALGVKAPHCDRRILGIVRQERQLGDRWFGGMCVP